MRGAERIVALGLACLALAILGWWVGFGGLLVGLALFALGTLVADRTPPADTGGTTTERGSP